MNKILLSCLIMTIALSCDQSINKNNPADIVKKDTITQSEIISSKDENENLNQDTILNAGIDTFSIRLQMNGIKDRKIIPLNIVSGKELFAVLYKENSDANIRINQIKMPDSSSDGPFGDSLHYKIKMHGIYRIIIGADLMAAGKSDEAFTLKAWAK